MPAEPAAKRCIFPDCSEDSFLEVQTKTCSGMAGTTAVVVLDPHSPRILVQMPTFEGDVASIRYLSLDAEAPEGNDS